MEIEGFKFLIDGIRTADIFYSTIDLQTIIVHDHAEIIQISGAGKHSCLPYLTFLDLTITK